MNILEMPLNEAFIFFAMPLSITILIFAIGYNILEYKNDVKVQKRKKSIVETGSMSAFAMLCYIFYVKSYGVVNMPSIAHVLGAIVAYISTFINIYGRIILKSNWSNQIRIRDDHKLVEKGPYKYVRHPLYSSIITLIYASGLIYSNIGIIVLNTIIFVPLMIYRGKQEEKELCKYVEGYIEYQKRVPMLFPYKKVKK